MARMNPEMYEYEHFVSELDAKDQQRYEDTLMLALGSNPGSEEIIYFQLQYASTNVLIAKTYLIFAWELFKHHIDVSTIQLVDDVDYSELLGPSVLFSIPLWLRGGNAIFAPFRDNENIITKECLDMRTKYRKKLTEADT